MRPSTVFTCTLLAWLITARTVHAECPTTTAQRLLQGPADIVFSGLVIDITRTADFGYRASFLVDRVWKGVAAEQFTVYVWELAPETAGFKLKERRVVVVSRLTDSKARKGVGLGDTDTHEFTPVPCTGPNELGPNIIRDLGPGRPPTRW
jgi:hypothetical protein